MAALKKNTAPDTGGPVWGLVAEFDGPASISRAAEKVRDAGYKKWDVYAPIPIHGIDEAMGLKSPKVGLLVGMGALIGCSGALLMQWFLSDKLYRVTVSGKPFWAWEQFTPVTFELSVLFSAFAALLGMLALNGLPRWHHPLFGVERFLRVSDDRFVIAIEARDAKFDAARTRQLLADAGGQHIETVVDQ